MLHDIKKNHEQFPFFCFSFIKLILCQKTAINGTLTQGNKRPVTLVYFNQACYINICHLPKGKLNAFISWFKQDECFIPPNKSGAVMEGFVVPALACVHQSGLTVQGRSHCTCCPRYLQSLFWAKSCPRPVGGEGGDWHKGNQQSPSSWALRNTIGAKLLSIQPTVVKVFWVQNAAKALELRPDVWLDCPILMNSIVIAVIHEAIVLSTCHTTSSRWPAVKSGHLSFSKAVPPAISMRAPTPAPGVLLWVWHLESSWALAPSRVL